MTLNSSDFFDHASLPPFAVAHAQSSALSFGVRYYGAMQDVLLASAGNMQHVPTSPPDRHAPSIADYARLFATLPRPDRVLQHYWRDSFFAEQRVSGPNPLVIRRVRTESELARLKERFALDDAQLKHVVTHSAQGSTHATLEALVAAERLFVADYQILEKLPSGTHAHGSKYLVAPLVAFCWRSTGQANFGELVPFAIQLGQDLGAPVFTPRDVSTWSIAKLFVQIADANHHEMASHLARTHLAIEPFAVATVGVLPEAHCVRQFLAPFLQYVSPRNLAARERLINPGGPVDSLLASTLDGSLEIARRSRDGYRDHPAWGLKSTAFWNDITQRGLERSPLHYPFRDDGRLVWDALTTYTQSYVRAMYGASDAVALDAPLQQWAGLLADPRGGAVREMPGRLTTIDELAEVLRNVAFLSGPQHAAVNFPQYEFMTYAPNMPLAAYSAPPGMPGHGTGGDPAIESYLPPLAAAGYQFIVIHGLSAYRHDRLGDFTGFTFDAKVTAAIEELGDTLGRVERIILKRNAVRRTPYDYLRPSLIPNSASV